MTVPIANRGGEEHGVPFAGAGAGWDAAARRADADGCSSCAAA